MKKTDKIVTIAVLILCVMYVIACFAGYGQRKAKEQALEECSVLNDKVNSFVLLEEETEGEIKVVKAYYYATLNNGNVLLETEDGQLHEFDNLDAQEFDEFRILFDDNGFVGLWQAV